MPVEMVEQKFIIKFIAFDRGKSGGRPALFNSKLSRMVQPERPVWGRRRAHPLFSQVQRLASLCRWRIEPALAS